MNAVTDLIYNVTSDGGGEPRGKVRACVISVGGGGGGVEAPRVSPVVPEPNTLVTTRTARARLARPSPGINRRPSAAERAAEYRLVVARAPVVGPRRVTRVVYAVDREQYTCRGKSRDDRLLYDTR